MVFIKHKKGRKDQGITSASQTVKCYKCEKEIEMGAVFTPNLVIADIRTGNLVSSVTPVTKVCLSTFN